MQRVLKWFAPLLMGGVAIFLLFFLISINSEHVYIESEPLVLEQNITHIESQESWLNHFSKSERLGYFYPVNEVYVKVDLNEKITKVITYKLSAKVLDPYQLFCLKEELKRHELKYYLMKNKTVINLLIYSQDVNKLNSLVAILRNYKISASVEPYKEDY
ncbi:MAG: hypothetical protein JXQ67_05485 [Campylobacterales bacterium]|nr:hypothetical protein [Campylobacterales bacterium]